MSATNLNGWELMRKSFGADINKDADHIVGFVHWYLTQKAHFGCLGNGNDLKLLPSDKSSELLPDDWNCSPKTYALRYQDGDKVYVLLGTISGETLVLNLLSANKMELSNVQFVTADAKHAVLEAHTHRKVPAGMQAIMTRLTDDLLKPVFESNQQHVETQTNEPTTSADAQRQRDASTSRERLPYYGPQPEDPRPGAYGIGPLRPDRDPLAVGRGDLDPFGAGGGMLFQPPGRPDVGGVGQFPGRQPGARFDPFGPPGGVGPAGPGGLGRPRPDHMQPPDFGNDDWYQ